METPAVSLPGGPPRLAGGAGAAGRAPLHGNPFGERQTERPSHRGGLRGRIGSVLAAIAALIAKFFAVIKGALLFLPKIKLLSTAGTALISVAAYSLWFGWTFALGFGVLLLGQQMVHGLQLRREGSRA